MSIEALEFVPATDVVTGEKPSSRREIHRGPISARIGKIAAELDTMERSTADLRKALEDIKGLL